MKFAIPFFLNFQYCQDTNVQFNIKYKSKIKELSDFIETYETHRINLIFEDLSNLKYDIKLIKTLKDQYINSDLVMALPPTITKEQLQQIKDNQLKFYFNVNVRDIDEFNYFLELGVCDIKIGGWLGFFLKNLSKKAKEKHVAIRVQPDICQSYNPSSPSFKSFFIRPEDIDVYANYVDTFEFAHDKKVLNTIYEIYAKDKKWYGRLNEIILGYEGQEDSRYILPTFAEIRTNCKKRCIYELNNHCNICGQIKSLGETLKQKNIIVEVNNGTESN